MSARQLGTRRRVVLAPALAVAAAVTAACGTTVPVTSQVSQQQDGAGGLTTGTTGGAQPGGITPTAPDGSPSLAPEGGAAGGSAAGGSDAGAVTPGTRAPRQGAAPTGVATSAPGVTATTITIGALTASGAGEYQRALGFSAGASGDQIAMVRSVVDWLNARGGIAGRTIKLVLHDVAPSDAGTNPAAAYEAACNAFTQDNKVFAVASILSHVTSNFYECLRKHGVFVVTANPALSSRFFRQFAGTLYAPTNPSYTRVLADSVDALWAEGWLTSASKVGVVGFDTPDAHATVTDGLIPALKRHGLTLTADFYTPDDTTGAASAYSGGVLRFKAAGVDRVFFAPGGQPIYFGLAAQQQAYQPFMELSTLEYPDPVANTLPAETLRGAAGVGWSPFLDLDNASAGKVTTPAKAACIEAVKSAQQDLSTGTTLAIATWICDDWFFLRDGLARAPRLAPAGFRAGVESLGSSYRAANTFQTFFAPGRPADGAAAYRLIKFDGDCRCFRYTSGIRPMP